MAKKPQPEKKEEDGGTPQQPVGQLFPCFFLNSAMVLAFKPRSFGSVLDFAFYGRINERVTYLRVLRASDPMVSETGTRTIPGPTPLAPK